MFFFFFFFYLHHSVLKHTFFLQSLTPWKLI
uniref:Uncharacterized protein n=1 Tax=Anguilla anguilla TaxID=7936 RepID=A0A0E9RH42_ANGAN